MIDLQNSFTAVKSSKFPTNSILGCDRYDFSLFTVLLFRLSRFPQTVADSIQFTPPNATKLGVGDVNWALLGN